MFSGRTNYVGMQSVEGAVHKERLEEAYLVELIAEVYRVDVVTLEVGEHDDLRAEWDKIGVREGLEGGG